MFSNLKHILRNSTIFFCNAFFFIFELVCANRFLDGSLVLFVELSLQAQEMDNLSEVGSGSMGDGMGGGMRGGSITLAMVWGVVWDSFVFDISDVSVFVISMVGDNLGTTIGKSHSVFSGYNSVFILSFFLVKVGARVFITDSISVGERTGWDFVASMVRGGMGGGVVRGGGAGRGGEGGGHEGGGKDELQRFDFTTRWYNGPFLFCHPVRLVITVIFDCP